MNVQNILNWITNNPVLIFVVIVIIVALVLYLYKNKKDILAKAALYAVSKAEEAWGSSTGKIKFAEVYTYLRKQFPLITFFFTEKQLTDIIETALTQMKEILATKASKEDTSTK